MGCVVREDYLVINGSGFSELADTLCEVGPLRKTVDDVQSDKAVLLERIGELKEEMRIFNYKNITTRGDYGGSGCGRLFARTQGCSNPGV